MLKVMSPDTPPATVDEGTVEFPAASQLQMRDIWVWVEGDICIELRQICFA